MRDELLLVMVLVWLIGTWLRLYQQARFYQIEEYMSGRYLAWLRRNPKQALPMRAVTAWLLGTGIAVLLGDSHSAIPFIIMLIAALIAALPRREKEIKKTLAMTGRVKRMLAGSAFISAIALLLAVHAVAADVILAGAIGLLLYLLAPLWLMTGSLLMQPYEKFMRRRYLRQAKRTLTAIYPKVIGVTGSYGKTTTKAFLQSILDLRYRTYATPKSYNTLMGVALAINRDLAEDYRCEYFISEMGAYVPGEIARICRLTPPDIAIVTEVGPQHLERFGSLENVQRAKYEIIKNLPPDGVGVFNWDNAHIREMIAKGYPATRLSVSRQLSVDEARRHGLTWIADDISESLEGIRFKAIHVPSGESARMRPPVLGQHNVTNLLLCIAVAYHEGLSLRDIAMRISALRPAESRLARQVSPAGITIINDANSANPVGVVSALKVLGMHQSGKRLLITPGMVELGALQDSENQKLGALAAQQATDIILIGREQTKALYRGIQSADFDMSRVRVYETLAESVAWYQQNLAPDDTVLFLNDLPDTY